MDHTLIEAIRARLETQGVPTSVAERALAACGAEAPSIAAEGGAPVGPRSAWLSRVEVQGFRGIAEPVELELTAGPGLVVLAGRNGSGKSSLAEAVEALLTGTLQRWGDRVEFQEGWRNLHHRGVCRVTADFVLEGREDPVALSRTWSGDDVKDSALTLDGRPASLQALGWDDAVRTWRPILGGGLARKLEQRPSELFDAIAGVLGLEAVVEAYKELGAQRRELQNRGKEVQLELQKLRARLQDADDPRAEQALTWLADKAPPLDALERLAVTDISGERVERLRKASVLELPSREEVEALADGLRTGAARLAELSDAAVTRSEALANLLSRALDVVEEGMDCPVCGAALDPAWEQDARDRIEASRAAAAEIRTQRNELDRLVKAARQQLYRPDERKVRGLGELDLNPELEPVAEGWWAGRHLTDPVALAEHLVGLWPALAEAVEAVRAEARDRLEAQHARWAPIAGELQRWVERRREADRAAEEADQHRQAEKLLKDLEAELRTERFRPIREQARRLWDTLGQDSNVALENVELLGSRNRRKLGLDVTVDGEDASALGVMSQGEINALALSLFVPRTTMQDSPFRFVIIDDPVHAMDPHKVDGLARVLGELAETRQTLVFTHDQRLLESLRRLRIRATVYQVERKTRSRVKLVQRKDPVMQCLDDAHVVRSAGAVPPEVTRRLVPGFCREALEARLVEVVRRRRLGRGEPHDEVEALLDKNRTLVGLTALALFDRRARGSEIEEKLGGSFGADAVEVVKALNAGTHGDFDGDLGGLIRSTRKLVEELEALP